MQATCIKLAYNYLSLPRKKLSKFIEEKRLNASVDHLKRINQMMRLKIGYIINHFVISETQCEIRGDLSRQL